MNFNQILETYGIAGLAVIALISVILLAARVVYLAAKALFERSNSDTKQDDTIRELLLSLNKNLETTQEREREQQQRNNHLNAELTELKVEQGKEAGRREEIKEAMQRERDEWKAERAEWKAERTTTDNNIREMQTNILDLQKNQRDNQAKIRELESQIETLNKRIVDKDGEIATLQTAIVQLQAEKAQLMEQNTELGKQVVYHSSRVANLSQLVNPPIKTEAPLPPTPPTDSTQAIPDLRVWDEDAEQTFITPPDTPPVPSEPITETKPQASNPAA